MSSRVHAASASFAFSLLAVFAVGCSDAPSADLSLDANSEVGVNASLFRETAPWTGRLILPHSDERRSDGSVQVEIHNSPYSALRGKTVWVRYAANPALQARVRSVTRTIAFGDAARKSMAKGNIHPVRLDGWADVSPLESLAGAHVEDDVLVALPGAALEGETLVMSREPMMIAGDYVGLVTIKEPAGAGAFKVVHYKKTDHDFTGLEETLTFDSPAVSLGDTGPVLSPTAGIEKSPENRLGGYFIHAVRGGDGQLHVRGLVPRKLRTLPSVVMRNGTSATVSYTESGMWDPIENASKGKVAKGSSSSTLLVPNGNTGEARGLAWQRDTLMSGTKLLLIHTFGATGPAEDGYLRTGHFAFGIGTIVDEPLTGDLALDIEYKQVYAHNGRGIVAGSHDHASYFGTFDRGWMYSRPIADVALYLPALNRDYSLGGVGIGRPIDGLSDELDAMAARYRTGLGTGSSAVTPGNSCVQDSSKALYFALAKLREKTDTPDFKSYLSAHATDPEVIDFNQLTKLTGKIEGYLSPLGLTRLDWKIELNRTSASDVNACPGGKIGALVCGLASYNTMIPRRGSDFYTKELLLAGAGGIALRSNDIGGEMPGIIPLSPTNLVHMP